MPLPKLDERFYWSRGGHGHWMLMFDGMLCGMVDREGNYRVDWRGRRTVGRLPRVPLARKMMERWFAARQHLPPRSKRARRTEMMHFSFSAADFLRGSLLAIDDTGDELLF